MIAKGDGIAPIPGTKRVKYLEENAAAADLELSESDLAEIDAVMDPDRVVGERYPEWGMAGLDRD